MLAALATLLFLVVGGTAVVLDVFRTEWSADAFEPPGLASLVVAVATFLLAPWLGAKSRRASFLSSFVVLYFFAATSTLGLLPDAAGSDPEPAPTTTTTTAAPTAPAAPSVPTTGSPAGADEPASDADDDPSIWLTIGLAVPLIGGMGKLLLLQRYGRRAATASRPKDEMPTPLLPFQRRNLNILLDAINGKPLRHAGHVVQLEGRGAKERASSCGRWLLGSLGAKLSGAAPVADGSVRREEHRRSAGELGYAVARIDVWEHDTEPDLHRAIMDGVLSAPEYVLPYGWLRYPVSLLAPASLVDVSLELSNRLGKVSVPFRMPRLPHQRFFERITQLTTSRDCRTVIILDEVDRSSVQPAQAAITLIRRALDLEGVVVVLAYVEPLMAFKAFNPLNQTLPDLGSTMLAVLDDYLRKGGRALLEPEALRARQEAAKVEEKGGPVEKKSEELTAIRPSEEDYLRRRLAEDFDQIDDVNRMRLFHAFAEKFLGTTPIRMARADAEDIARIPIEFSGLTPIVARLRGMDVDQFLKDEEQLFVSKLTADIQFQKSDRDLRDLPSVRSVEGELFRLLSAVELERAGRATVFELSEVVAVCVLAVWLAATRSLQGGLP